MPVLVVDQLESVEIQKHHRKALAVATRLRHLQVKAVVQRTRFGKCVSQSWCARKSSDRCASRRSEISRAVA